MENCSLDIAGQSGWDLWVGVCALTATVLLIHLVTRGGRERTRLTTLSLGVCIVGIAGTAIVILVPGLHRAGLGLCWTFVALFLLSIVFYIDLIGRLTLRQTLGLLVLRGASLLLLVLMLFDPVQRCYRAWKPQRPLMILVDTSGSLSFPDVQNGPTRIQSVWQAIQPLLDKINRSFVPAYFTFDSSFHELKSAQDLQSLKADGRSTDLVQGITNTLARLTREDAAFILLSDGNDNTSPDVVGAIRDSTHPLNTVSVGSDQTEQAAIANIAVADVETAEDFVVGHETLVKATIRSSALPNRVVEVKLSEIDAGGKSVGPVTAQSLVLQPVAAGQSVKLPYTPHATGLRRLAVWVDPVPGEQNVLDNRQELQGLAIDPRIKVLYIEGRLRPEYRDLNRTLQRDPNIEVAALLRLQKDRFAASGTVDGIPFASIPITREQWNRFDVVILGDLDHSFLPPAQQAALNQRVQRGGGGLLGGGQDNCAAGGYAGTPIEQALPVFMGDPKGAQDKQEFVPRLTPDGMTHPALEGLQQWFGGGDSAQPATRPSLPPLRGNVITGPAKSGAQVLLIHPGTTTPDGSAEIMLATERFGKGRSAAFTVDTTYLWNLPLYGMGQDSPYSRVWAQLVRWLAGTDVRNRQKGAGIEALLNKSLYTLGENVSVRAMVRDEHGDATRYAQVQVKLTQTGKSGTQTLTLAPVESQNGMYGLVLPHPGPGTYTATLIGSKDGTELGRQDLRFSVIPPADEMLKIAANPKLMEAIARETHGSHFDLGGLGTLLDELIAADPHPRLPTLRLIAFDNLLRALPAEFGFELNWNPKFDLPMQGMLVIVLLTVEWILRRRWQLP